MYTRSILVLALVTDAWKVLSRGVVFFSHKDTGYSLFDSHSSLIFTQAAHPIFAFWTKFFNRPLICSQHAQSHFFCRLSSRTVRLISIYSCTVLVTVIKSLIPRSCVSYPHSTSLHSVKYITRDMMILLVPLTSALIDSRHSLCSGVRCEIS